MGSVFPMFVVKISFGGNLDFSQNYKIGEMFVLKIGPTQTNPMQCYVPAKINSQTGFCYSNGPFTCFALGWNLEILDFLQKSFITLTTGLTRIKVDDKYYWKRSSLLISFQLQRLSFDLLVCVSYSIIFSSLKVLDWFSLNAFISCAWLESSLQLLPLVHSHSAHGAFCWIDKGVGHITR